MALFVFASVITCWWGSRLGELVGDIIVDYVQWKHQR